MGYYMKIHLLIGLYIFSFLTSSVAADMTELNFAGDDHFPPYSYMENGVIKGIDCDVIREVAKRLNIKVNITLAPFKRILHLVKTGGIDGGFSMFKTDERESFAYYTGTPIHKSTYHVFVNKKDIFPINKISDLYGKVLGKNLGFVISDEFDKAVKEKKIQVTLSEGHDKNIRLLVHHRIDGFIAQKNVTLFELKRKDLLGTITHLPFAITKARPAYLTFSKLVVDKDPEKKKLLKKISKTLEQIEKDGTYNKIQEKYTQGR